jgi:hypothetical protein
MKNYSKTERLEHLEKWGKSSMSKRAYAKTVGIEPTTFYTWSRNRKLKEEQSNEQGFVEIHKEIIPKSIQEIVIEKGSITVRLPLGRGLKELETVFTSLGGIS